MIDGAACGFRTPLDGVKTFESPLEALILRLGLLNKQTVQSSFGSESSLCLSLQLFFLQNSMSLREGTKTPKKVY